MNELPLENVVGQMIAHGELELGKASDQPAGAPSVTPEPVDAEQEEK